MKKQLIAAAVAATFAASASADLSIGGSAEVTIAQNSIATETVLNLRGKSDAGSVVLDLKSTDRSAPAILNSYVKTDVMGLAVKAGTWKSGKGELSRSSVKSGAYNVSTSLGGMKVAYEETGTGSGNSITLAGTVGGVKLSHKINNQSDATDTKASGSFGGVDASYLIKDNGTNSNTALTLATAMNGVSVKYTSIDVETAISGGIDGSIADTTNTINVGKHSALALTTNVAGNSVTFKRSDLNDATTNKFIVKRGNMKATYNDTTENLEVELTVKF